MTAASSSENDIRAIETIIARQLRNVSWSATKESDWLAFANDFLPGAPLYPASRPLQPQTVDAFVQRMQQLAQGSLRSFDQTGIGTTVHVFGNVAIAFGACQNVENEKDVVRGVEAYLFVKIDNDWRIAAQSWDTESGGDTVPDDLLSPN